MVIGFVSWVIATGWLFDYTVNVFYPEDAFGELIWVIASVGFLYISIPLEFVFLLGLCLICAD
ncbi:MAG: hypothetical protein EAX81_03175 [Candidatus Thorarchaeota archaeon]|nr:hypothetical protein [Candidatus Thorarchaeota archaeon]